MGVHRARRQLLRTAGHGIVAVVDEARSTFRSPTHWVADGGYARRAARRTWSACGPSSLIAQESTAASRGASKTWSKLDDAALLDALRTAGHIIVFRYCATDGSQKDRRDLDLTKRENQRNLSALGEADAQALGTAFKKLGIPFATARSSEMFRCKDSAQMVFGSVETTKDLMGRDGAALRKLLTQAPVTQNELRAARKGAGLPAD